MSPFWMKIIHEKEGRRNCKACRGRAGCIETRREIPFCFTLNGEFTWLPNSNYENHNQPLLDCQWDFPRVSMVDKCISEKVQ